MGAVIELNGRFDSGELLYIKELDERLEPAGPESDSRVNLTNAHIVLSEMDDCLHVSLLGRVGDEAIAITVAGENLGQMMPVLLMALCANFKVDDSPF